VLAAPTGDEHRGCVFVAVINETLAALSSTFLPVFLLFFISSPVTQKNIQKIGQIFFKLWDFLKKYQPFKYFKSKYCLLSYLLAKCL